jgi:hypothetical protein
MNQLARKDQFELRVRRRRPVLVCKDGEIVADAIVIVSEWDPNWYRHRIGMGFDGEIRVRCKESV